VVAWAAGLVAVVTVAAADSLVALVAPKGAAAEAAMEAAEAEVRAVQVD